MNQLKLDLEKGRETVAKAGKQLIERGLIARTWGNVSCRVSKSRFVITPSGRSYQTLAPGEIVPVNIEDCSYEGNIEPSSEIGIHAEVYRKCPDVNFVIHTHQPCASAVSVLRENIDVGEVNPSARELLGDAVVSVAYGLPGSRELKEEVASALKPSRVKAYLLTAHGALCLGLDSEDAFRVTSELEKTCRKYIGKRYRELYGGFGGGTETGGMLEADLDQIRVHFVLKHKLEQDPRPEDIESCFDPLQLFYNSIREESQFRLYTGGSSENPFPEKDGSSSVFELGENGLAYGSKNEPFSGYLDNQYRAAVEAHRSIYRVYDEVNAIIHAVSPNIVACSRVGRFMYPLLDDFAQIIGAGIPVVSDGQNSDKLANKIAGQFRGKNAVLIANSGAICRGSSRNDVEAAVQILDKNCKAFIVASLLGRVEPISKEKCILMRNNYLKRYSRKDLLK